MSTKTATAENSSVPITSLPPQALSQVQQQLDGEVQHLSVSAQSLRTAQARFRDCRRSIQVGLASEAEQKKTVLVPLTASLYVPGRLSAPGPDEAAATTTENEVMVDIGTGYYVSKSLTDADDFYTRKVADLDKNIAELDKVLKTKSENLQMVERVLRQKLFDESKAAKGPAGKA